MDRPLARSNRTPWTPARVLLSILGAVVGLWALYALAGVLALVVLSVFFAYVVSPAVTLVQRLPFLAGRPWSRTAAVAMVYATLLAAVILAITAIAPRLGAQLVELGHRAPGYLEAARSRTQTIVGTYRTYQIPPGIRTAVEAAALRAFDTVGGSVRDTAATVLGWLRFLPWLILIPILAFFFLRDAETFRRVALHLLPAGRLRWRGQDYLEEINRTLALYVRAQLAAGVIVGLVCSVGFVILGVPEALVLGVLAGLLEFVPLVGPLIVAVVAGFLASTHSLGLMGGTLLFLAVLRFVQDYVVYPRLVANGIELHPLAVILTLLCGADLAGVAGLFLAIPVAAILMVSYRYLLLQLGAESLLAALAPRRFPEQPVLARPGERTLRRPPSASGDELAGIRVAVVDNDQDARAALVDLLTGCGATVFDAGSAREALTALERDRPDVLLSDLAMPDQDGFDLIRCIRALPPEGGGSIRAVALSGYASKEDRDRTINAGFQAHLSKPVDPVELIATVLELARPLPSAGDARG
jgi:predicted PurR-regulated permease PerM/CheY-like chemotaxis protein